MRQAVAFAKASHTRKGTDLYYRMKFEAQIHGHELQASLNEVLGIPLSEEPSVFTPEADQAMEERAQQLLNERKALKREFHK